MQDWVLFYQEYLYNRYQAYARGGGDWAPLADSTVRKKGHNLILIESGFMIENFNPTFRKPSQLSINIPFGIRVQIPDVNHPEAKTSLYNLMSWHANGSSILPVRKIVVPPTSAVKKQMGDRMKLALKSMGVKVK